MKSFGIVILLSLTSAACVGQSAPAHFSSDEQSIRSQRATSNQAIAAGDIAGFAASLEPGFVVVTGNGSFLSRERYIATFAKDFEDPHSVRFERFVDSVEMSSSLPLAAEHGHWEGHVPGGPAIFRGTYLAMWRKSEGGWKLRSELFVSLACGDAMPAQAIAKSTAQSRRSRVLSEGLQKIAIEVLTATSHGYNWRAAASGGGAHSGIKRSTT